MWRHALWPAARRAATCYTLRTAVTGTDARTGVERREDEAEEAEGATDAAEEQGRELGSLAGCAASGGGAVAEVECCARSTL